MDTTRKVGRVYDAVENLSPAAARIALAYAEQWRDAKDRRTVAAAYAYQEVVALLNLSNAAPMTRTEYMTAVIEALDPAAELPESEEERYNRQMDESRERRFGRKPAPRLIPRLAPQPRSQADALVERLQSLDPGTAAFIFDLAATWRGLDRLVPAAYSDDARDYLLRQIALVVGRQNDADARAYIRTIHAALNEVALTEKDNA